jgi:hypothetical protein
LDEKSKELSKAANILASTPGSSLRDWNHTAGGGAVHRPKAKKKPREISRLFQEKI